jgi:hypothetical protein
VTINFLDEPFLKPLLHDLESLNIAEYLATNEFRKLMVKNKLHHAWEQFHKDALNMRMIHSFDLDMTGIDRDKALSILFNRCYDQSAKLFYEVATVIMEAFLIWKKDQLPALASLIDTLETLDFPEEHVAIIKGFQVPVIPELIVPEFISDAKQLEEFLNKMNTAIKDKDHNLALTYAYSCLEGVFKAYLKTQLPMTAVPLELQKQAAVVRDDIKRRLSAERIEYPEQILALTGTISSAIGNARNGHSISHFDGKADKWLAEFGRDCVIAVARMVLSFLNE